MNAFRQLIKAAGGHPPIGTWIGSASPLVAEVLGQAGFEWGVIDMEHSPVGVGDLLGLLHAVGATKMVPVVRVPSGDPVVIGQVLDLGASTLLVPSVDGAGDARAAVAATRHAPRGRRGVDPTCRAARFGSAPGHLRSLDQSVGLICAIESVEALGEIEAIAAVDGVDALFVGPADLSASTGQVGQFTHPEVLGLMAQAVQRARRCGKPIGTVGPTPEAVAQYRAIGFDFVAVGSDIGLLMRAAHAAIEALRTRESVHVHTLASGTQTMAGA